MVITWLPEQTVGTNMAPCVAWHGLCDATEGEEEDEEEKKKKGGACFNARVKPKQCGRRFPPRVQRSSRSDVQTPSATEEETDNISISQPFGVFFFLLARLR